MTTQTLDGIGTIAAETAMKAAAEWLRINGLQVIDYEAATESLRLATRGAVGEALAEAEAALASPATAAYAQTAFLATIRTAAIRAAQTWETEPKS